MEFFSPNSRPLPSAKYSILYMFLTRYFTYTHHLFGAGFSVLSTVHEIRSQTNRENRRIINLRIINWNTAVLNRRIFYRQSPEEAYPGAMEFHNAVSHDGEIADGNFSIEPAFIPVEGISSRQFQLYRNGGLALA